MILRVIIADERRRRERPELVPQERRGRERDIDDFIYTGGRRLRRDGSGSDCSSDSRTTSSSGNSSPSSSRHAYNRRKLERQVVMLQRQVEELKVLCGHIVSGPVARPRKRRRITCSSPKPTVRTVSLREPTTAVVKARVSELASPTLTSTCELESRQRELLQSETLRHFISAPLTSTDHSVSLGLCTSIGGAQVGSEFISVTAMQLVLARLASTPRLGVLALIASLAIATVWGSTLPFRQGGLRVLEESATSL